MNRDVLEDMSVSPGIIQKAELNKIISETVLELFLTTRQEEIVLQIGCKFGKVLAIYLTKFEGRLTTTPKLCILLVLEMMRVLECIQHTIVIYLIVNIFFRTINSRIHLQ